MLAIANIVDHRIVLAIQRHVAGVVARQQRVAGDAESRYDPVPWIGVGAGHVHGVGQIGRRPIVQELAVEAHIAATEFLGDVQLDLAALRSVIADAARPLDLVIEAADMEAQGVGELGAVIEVEPILATVQASGRHDRAARHVTGLGDHVDDPAGRIGREGRGGAAANGID